MHNRILLPSNNENEILYISETKVDKEFKPVRHSHSNLEILFFTEGEGLVITENRKIKVKRNDIMIINMNAAHFEYSNNNFKFLYKRNFYKKINIFFIR